MNWKDLWETYSWVGVGLLYLLNELRKYVKEKWKNRPLTDEANITDQEIDPIVDELQKKYTAMRVHVFQFHDGTKAYSGQSLQRKTMTHEAVAYGATRLKQEFDNVLISDSMHRIIKILRTDGEYYVSNYTEVINIDRELYAFMVKNKIMSLYYLRITDLKMGTTIGTLNMHWPIPNGIVSDIEKSDIRGYRRKIENVFEKI